jgi:serine/threonine protein kinase
VRVFEIIDTSNYIYITSEYLEGGVLLEKLSKKKFLSENQARFYMFDILYAINYCHLKGIIHSDLKPENLLFTKKENGRNIVKINDFSTSRISLNRSNKNSQLSGTVKPNRFIICHLSNSKVTYPKSPTYGV